MKRKASLGLKILLQAGVTPHLAVIPAEAGIQKKMSKEPGFPTWSGMTRLMDLFRFTNHGLRITNYESRITNYALRFTLYVIAALLGIFVATGRPALAFTEAGTHIYNTSFATYEDTDGFIYHIQSNTVELTVAQVYAINITPDGTTASPGQKKNAYPGGEVYLPYVLTNPGNGPDSYQLDVENLPGDDEDLSNLKIYIDENQNGVVDPSEPVYDNTNPPLIDSGGRLYLVIAGTVPASVASGTIFVNVNGTSNGDGTKVDNENVSKINITADGFIEAYKSADKTEVDPGGTVTFTIEFQNKGSKPVLGTDIFNCNGDFDNDGTTETAEQGLLVADVVPDHLTYIDGSATWAPLQGFPVFAGTNGIWKDDASDVTGSIESVGLFIPEDASGETLVPDQGGFVSFRCTVNTDAPVSTISNTAEVKYANLNGHQVTPTNTVEVDILPRIDIRADDTDEINEPEHEGSGVASDEHDVMWIDHAASGACISFENEVWNLGNVDDVINVTFDQSRSENLPDGAATTGVLFYNLDGALLTDSNGDGKPDVGVVSPGESVHFITKVCFPEGSSANDVVIAVEGSSSLDPSKTDLTFNRTGEVVAASVKVNVIVGNTEEPWVKKKVIVYEYDCYGNLTDQKVFWTDSSGFIAYDEFGNSSPLYNWIEDSDPNDPDCKYTYRIGLTEDYSGFTYYVSPGFSKSDIDQTTSSDETPKPGTGGKITTQKLPSGGKVLSASIDPAGYVYDGVTGERIDRACVVLYKCNDSSCSSYTAVDASLLDVYPDGSTLQDNPQVSGPTNGSGTDVGKGDGAFEFKFSDFTPTDEGWYFVEVDFDCGLPASDANLANDYNPVLLNSGATWDPSSGAPYHGQRFYIDATNSGAINMRIPLLPADFVPIEIKKEVNSDIASIGDPLKFTITVTNPSPYTCYDVDVIDTLPKELRYRKGTTTIDGAKADDPEISSDARMLTWNIGNLDPGGSVKITFYAIVGANITEGAKRANVVRALGWSDDNHSYPIESSPAYAYFKLTKGVFTDKAYIIGKVFIDEPNCEQLSGEIAITRTIEYSLEDSAKDKDAKIATLLAGQKDKSNFASLDRMILIHKVFIHNKSQYPFYSISYKEDSAFKPIKGSSLLEGDLIHDPKAGDGALIWKIKDIEPGKVVVLTFASESKDSDVDEIKCEIPFSIEKDNIKKDLKVELPIIFKMQSPDEYQLAVYFDFGKYNLSQNDKAALDKVIKTVKAKGYKKLYVSVKAYTDSVRVMKEEERAFQDNLQLSGQRAETVRKYLADQLIEMQKVEVVHEDVKPVLKNTFSIKVVTSNDRASISKSEKILKDKEIPSFVQEKIINYKTKEYTLYAGGFDKKETAEAAVKELSKVFNDGFVIEPTSVEKIFLDENILYQIEALGPLDPKVENLLSSVGTPQNRRAEVKIIPINIGNYSMNLSRVAGAECDVCGNGIQDNNEQGVSGVKIYMEDGRYVVTDSEGKYHIDNVDPGIHSLKVDNTTLPPGTSLAIINNRNMDDPESMFVDLFPGDIFKANFRLCPGPRLEATEKICDPLVSSIRVTRTIKDILIDPGSGLIRLKHEIIIENHSDLPLFETTYKEVSAYKIVPGTVSFNGSPFKDPKYKDGAFTWNLTLVKPMDEIHICFTSETPQKSTDINATLEFRAKPIATPKEIKVELPVHFASREKSIYELTVYFDFGKYNLRPDAVKTLDKIIETLRKKDYDMVYVWIRAHTDATRVDPSKLEYENNPELSEKRATIVREYLKAGLIDIKKIKVQSGEPDGKTGEGK